MNQVKTRQIDKVILGCGLSGMLTALAFAKNNGIETTIFESKSVKSHSFFNDIRTTVLTPASKDFLFSINIWQELEEFASSMKDVYVVDNKAPEMLELRNDSSLGYVVQNNDFKKILLSKIIDNPLITLIDNKEYQEVISHDEYSIIKLNNETYVKCNLLIICDGSNSKVRSHYFANEIEKPYQTALVFNIKHEKPHENCAMEHFLPLGPFALLPMKDQHSSSVIWSTSSEQAALIMQLPIEEVRFLTQSNAGNSLGKITIDSEIKGFPLKARIANRYFHNKIVLIADSAHIVHPLAGQGLNQGIKDIEALISVISKNLSLSEYQKSRQSDNFIMYKLTDELNNIFSNHSKSFKHLRQIGFKVINNFKPIKNLITSYAMGKR